MGQIDLCEIMLQMWALSYIDSYNIDITNKYKMFTYLKLL